MICRLSAVIGVMCLTNVRWFDVEGWSSLVTKAWTTFFFFFPRDALDRSEKVFESFYIVSEVESCLFGWVMFGWNAIVSIYCWILCDRKVINVFTGVVFIVFSLPLFLIIWVFVIYSAFAFAQTVSLLFSLVTWCVMWRW